MRATLAQIREQKGWSPSQLAAKSGVAVTTIAAIEKGAKPHSATIGKLSAALEVVPTSIAWPGHAEKWQSPRGVLFRASFRECLEQLEQLGTYVLDQGSDKRAVSYLLRVAKDAETLPTAETSRWHAPATLELYSELPEGSDILGNLETEHIMALAEGPYGPEVVFHKERFVIRSRK